MISIKYPIVVLDLDGTVLNSDKQISDRTFKSIMDCSNHGIRFFFATARPPRAVRSLLSDELLNIASLIYYNGAYINCKYTGIHRHEPIESILTADVLDYCLNINPELDISIEMKDEWMSLREYDYTTLMRVKGHPIVKSLQELKTIDATKILFSGKIDINLFKEKFASRLNIYVTDGGNLVQVSSIKASKENAVQILCKEMSIALDNVMVFGDDFNDLGLFRICGWPVAMGNAIEELKAIAKEITDTNDNDGVAKILERLL
ncbi:Cof-type HAD-IIB family hydrolase [Paenibacillus endoradicis]|uniref:Cof-type HAD-IIB family hydrolase n=1 Tax=Paenibacillus endoradicis TaxID=2972487 RepID=UPI00215967FC|nr:Cof-type HAD-IIB family hydrolase [Paenibacillus endoradicis]MCR8656681.1 Cof-type HAD-IIB family hydrolase [Paenibacillus endoradicis]